MDKDIIPIGPIEERIYTLRGKRVMLDADLARLYGVTTSRLNEQVRRNPDRFPEAFSFQASNQELAVLMSQNATSKSNMTDRNIQPLFEFLSDDALDRIDADIDTDGKDEGVLNISELDGLFTALVSGPEAVMPSRWLPVICRIAGAVPKGERLPGPAPAEPPEQA